MPQYKVTSPGFHGGNYYHPTGKRRTLSTDKPYTNLKGKNPMPSWLSKMPEESASAKKKREAYEAADAVEAKEKAEEDSSAIVDASFMGQGEVAQSGGKIETI